MDVWMVSAWLGIPRTREVVGPLFSGEGRLGQQVPTIATEFVSGRGRAEQLAAGKRALQEGELLRCGRIGGQLGRLSRRGRGSWGCRAGLQAQGGVLGRPGGLAFYPLYMNIYSVFLPPFSGCSGKPRQRTLRLAGPAGPASPAPS